MIPPGSWRHRDGYTWPGDTKTGADLALFGLTAVPATLAELDAAWKERVKQRFDDPLADMDALKQARNRLRDIVQRGGDVNPALESACKMCAGSGRIGTGFGRVCPSCKGTGHIT